MAISTHAKIRTQFEGFHRYPDAPKAVEFLSQTHRHVFHVTVSLQQFHNERDVEYILFKREIDKAISLLGLGRYGSSQSCETMAHEVLDYVRASYPNRDIVIEVSEDGENGAVVVYKHE